MKRRLLFLGICIILLGGCTGKMVETPEPDTLVSEGDIYSLFNEQEIAYLQKVKERGGLKAATVAYPGFYEISDGQPVRGFDFRLLKAMEEVLDIPVETLVLEEFNDFFTRQGMIPEGIKTDTSLAYVPDILEKVDIIAFELAEIPWRERLMSIIPLMPTRILVVTPRDHEIKTLGDLQKKRVLVYENTSHQEILEQTARRLGLDISIIPIPLGNDWHPYLDQNLADCMIGESQAVLKELPKDARFNASLALTKFLMNGWAIRKDNPILSSILEKFFSYAGEKGLLDEAMEDGYGISMSRYYNLINYREDIILRLSPEEEALLNGLRARGGLRAAIDGEQTVYEVSEEGIKTGLHYNLALAVAQTLEVPLRLRQVSFNEFFAKDGVVPDRIKTDPEYSYVPDLLLDVDLYIGTLSPLSWRKKFLSFIPLHPTKLVYLTRDDTPKIDSENLKGLVFSLLPNTSYEDWLKEHVDLSGLSVLEVPSGEEAVRVVSAGEADITISDANLAFARMRTYDNITFYPADNEVDSISWAVARNNLLLKNLLEKTLEHLMKTRVFNDIWEDYYGIPFSRYLELLSLGEEQ
ncbi:MAG: transporter substrate-binding domain-containing protein [Spirochaetales bacterium]|nr:transporter substrate-binding domain-containing protein [Spirochaetales bacterium]